MTAQEVFNITMAVADQLNETGAADYPDNYEYKYRTVPIINVLATELYQYSDTYTAPKKSGKRNVFSAISSISDDIDLDDYLCTAVLPYGLAAQLMKEEDPDSARFYQQKYEELKSDLSRGMLAESEDIEDVYSTAGTGIGFEWTTRW